MKDLQKVGRQRGKKQPLVYATTDAIVEKEMANWRTITCKQAMYDVLVRIGVRHAKEVRAEMEKAI